MNSKYLSFIALAVVSVLLIGCGGTSGTIDSFEKISKAIESGKSMKCVISMADANAGIPMDMVYWVKGKDMRIESTVQGMSNTMVQKGDTSYMRPQAMFGGKSDCDWVSIDDSDEDYDDSEEDFDFELYDNDPIYNVKCFAESFGADKFDVSGKVCTMEEMMGAMMGGFGM